MDCAIPVSLPDFRAVYIATIRRVESWRKPHPSGSLRFATGSAATPPSAALADGFGFNHTFDRMFANYWKHPEFKRLAPDGTGGSGQYCMVCLNHGASWHAPQPTLAEKIVKALKRNLTLENDGAVDRKRVQDVLHGKARRYRTLFELAPVAVYSCDASGVILDYNQRAAELWGRKPQLRDTDERFCGSFKLYRPDGSFMPHEQCPMGDVLTGKLPGVHDAEVHIERPDGSRIIVIVNIAPLRDDRGEITGAINCFYDVTGRKQVEEVLRDSIAERRRIEHALRDSETQLQLANEELESVVQRRTAALRHLSAKLLRVRDDEHRRIARNLHDSLGQYLAAVKMNLDMLKPSATRKQAELLSAALESIERSVVEVRTLSFLLHPPLLDEVGFASAARWYTDEFAKRSGIEVRLNLPKAIARLPESAEIALFRILQESLTNVHRHSGSSSVEISLTLTEKQAVLIVRDFGHGMAADLMEGSDLNDNHFGVGLSGMRERVADLGGTFAIESNPQGTAVMVALPLTPPPSAKAGSPPSKKNSVA